MRHNPGYGIMGDLVQNRRSPVGRACERLVRRHLDMVCRGGVESPIATDLDADAARLDDQIGVGDALSDRLWSLGFAKLGDSVELRSVEDDIGAQ